MLLLIVNDVTLIVNEHIKFILLFFFYLEMTLIIRELNLWKLLMLRIIPFEYHRIHIYDQELLFIFWQPFTSIIHY